MSVELEINNLLYQLQLDCAKHWGEARATEWRRGISSVCISEGEVVCVVERGKQCVDHWAIDWLNERLNLPADADGELDLRNPITGSIVQEQNFLRAMHKLLRDANGPVSSSKIVKAIKCQKVKPGTYPTHDQCRALLDCLFEGPCRATNPLGFMHVQSLDHFEAFEYAGGHRYWQITQAHRDAIANGQVVYRHAS